MGQDIPLACNNERTNNIQIRVKVNPITIRPINCTAGEWVEIDRQTTLFASFVSSSIELRWDVASIPWSAGRRPRWIVLLPHSPRNHGNHIQFVSLHGYERWRKAMKTASNVLKPPRVQWTRTPPGKSHSRTTIPHHHLNHPHYHPHPNHHCFPLVIITGQRPLIDSGSLSGLCCLSINSSFSKSWPRIFFSVFNWVDPNLVIASNPLWIWLPCLQILPWIIIFTSDACLAHFYNHIFLLYTYIMWLGSWIGPTESKMAPQDLFILRPHGRNWSFILPPPQSQAVHTANIFSSKLSHMYPHHFIWISFQFLNRVKIVKDRQRIPNWTAFSYVEISLWYSMQNLYQKLHAPHSCDRQIPNGVDPFGSYCLLK